MHAETVQDQPKSVGPLRKNGHEQFAQHVASGKNLTQSYILAGYSEIGASTAACRLAKNPKVAVRIDEIRASISRGLERLHIRNVDNRLSRQHDRWNRLHQVIEERAAAPEFAEVAGGKTGLLTRKLKQIGSGDTAQVVEEFEVDTGLLTEARKLEEHAAKELGQWLGDAKGSIDIRNQVTIAFPVISQEQAAQMSEAVEIDQTAAQKRLLSRPSDGKTR